ncbi:MAG: HAD-IIIA family hydrolase [Chromatiales bacterium]|nr:HAD-IIIA family hydrolase [Chromatiales bacterium]
MPQISDLSSVALVVFDVDGVFTDGRILIGPQGEEYKTFHTRDGHGVKRLMASGRQVAIISGRNATAVEHRMAELGVQHVFQGCKDKLKVLLALLEQLDISLENVAYMGDDLPDLEVMQKVGLPVTVSDGAPEIRSAASIVTRAAGGHGAVREFCDMLLNETDQ